MDTLFPLEEPVAGAENFDRDALQARLRELAARRIYIGGSSWKYEGWLGQVFERSRYMTRGKFSKKLFEEQCLSEYASVFPTCCGDFAFYQFPTDVMWARLFRQTPPPFRWGFKIPEQITVPVWPTHPRYGALSGLENPTFLDAAMLQEQFLRPLEPYRQQTGILIFEFGAQRDLQVDDFVLLLDNFLTKLPEQWRYAVEVRNADYLQPRYFDCLRAHNVTHVYNAWTRMPEMGDQMKMPGSSTTDLIVARALLKKGRPYEEAVEKFSPYRGVQEINQPLRDSMRELIDVAMVDGRPAFLFVNNRLEGNSPGTIVSITE